jgi:hypothetical protein
MAKQDLYKTAQQSAKLFKLIHEGEEMEGWVSSKITRAAADIESVYQYLNFEKHFKEQERAIDSNTSLSESTKAELRAKLAEAKDKVAKMKKKAAKEKDEKMEESKGATSGLDKTKGKVAKSEKANYFSKSTHGNVTKGARHQAGEGESDADLKNRIERDITTKGGKMDSWRKVDEGKKCCCEEKGKTKCPVHSKMDEAAEKTMSRAAKGNEKYGKDGMKALAKAGREGKSLEPVKAKYNKYDEAKELKGGQKKLDKDHNGKLDKKDFELLRNKKNIKEAIARAQIALDEGKKKSAGKPAWLEKAEVEAEEKSGKKVSKAEEKKVGIVKESAELDRLKFLTSVVLKG